MPRSNRPDVTCRRRQSIANSAGSARPCRRFPSWPPGNLDTGPLRSAEGSKRGTKSGRDRVRWSGRQVSNRRRAMTLPPPGRIDSGKAPKTPVSTGKRAQRAPVLRRAATCAVPAIWLVCVRFFWPSLGRLIPTAPTLDPTGRPARRPAARGWPGALRSATPLVGLPRRIYSRALAHRQAARTQ